MHRWSKKMRKQQNGNIPKFTPLDDGDPEQNLGDLKKSLDAYRDSFRAASEKPDHYWNRRHAEIMESLNRPASVRRCHPALAWAPAALMVIFFLFFFAETSKAPPKSDFAAGADEILLINVERALNQDYPEALAPAAFTMEEDRANSLKSK
jgi:hypothetical protein